MLQFQATAYEHHYRNVNWDKTHNLIQFNDEPAGAFIITQDGEEIRLADIVIDRNHRGLGIGLAIIQAIQGEASRTKRSLRLHVDRMSWQQGIYERLGFQLLEDRITHLFMEWLPPNLIGRKIYVPGC